jgi:Domain of unknown function (DUF4136)
MKSLAILLFGFMLTSQQTPPGKVDSTFDKKTDFSAIHTYSWTSGTHALIPEAHTMIVAAVDKEMAALGLKQAASGGDVTVAYYTMTLTNVDLKALDKVTDKSAPAPTKDLGKLVVVMRNNKREQVWSAVSREYLDNDRSKLDATIATVASRLFATYPTRARK